jgi:hypothetical protein
MVCERKRIDGKRVGCGTEKRRREEGRRGSGYLFELFSEEEEEERRGVLGLRGNPGVAHRAVPHIHKLKIQDSDDELYSTA